MFVNVQTGDAYVSAEEIINVDLKGNPTPAYLLTREDGTTKEVSAIAFKAWYQEDPDELPEKARNTAPAPKKSGKPGDTRKGKPRTKRPARPHMSVSDIGDDEVIMRAFTGMYIGVYKIAKQTKTYVVIKTSNGTELKFDKKTGKQLGVENPRFANSIEMKEPAEV